MMRRYRSALLLLLLLLFACRKFDNPFDPANNRPPDVPADPVPATGASKQDTVGLVLGWTGADPDSAVGDSATFDVFFGSVNPPPLADSGIAANAWAAGVLAVGTKYYWRVIARDTRGDSAAGPVWDFTADSNLRPDLPANPQPGNGASQLPTQVRLSWDGGDPNPGDTVVYDLYLGRTAPPPLLVRGVTGSEWTVTGLAPYASHYWKVVARDQDSAEAEGPVWQFMTMHQAVFTSPVGGESWRVGTVQPIRWSGGTDRAGGRGPAAAAARGKTIRAAGTDGIDSTVLYHSADSGATWLRIGPVATPGQYNWTVAGPEGANALVQVRIHVGRDVELAASPVFRVYDVPSPISVTAPVAGDRWRVGEQRTIRWTGGTDGMDSTVIHYSTNNGRNWLRVGRAVAAGSYEWSVPAPTTDSGRIRVRAFVAGLFSEALSGRFLVSSSLPVHVLEPTDSTRWRTFTVQTVRWQSEASPVDSAVVSYRPDTAGSWQRQGSTTGGSWQWTVPPPATERAQVQVALWQSGARDIGTSQPFVIYDTLPPGQPVVSSPAGGEVWAVGTVQEVTWGGGTDGMDSTVVRYSTDDGVSWLRQGVTSRPGRFSWAVAGPPSEQARIGIRSFCLGRYTDGVSNRFRVTGGGYPDSVVATLTVGERPVALCWNPRENKVYAANRNSGTVTVIDGATNGVITTVNAGSFPAALVYDSLHNKVYCANEGDRSVTVIDGATNGVLRTVTAGAGPRALAVNAANGRVYVANYGSGANSLTVIDGANDSVVATVACGERPRAVAWNPVNNRVYVACYAANSVTVIDGTTNAVLDSIRVGYSPRAVVVVENQNHVYVANSGSGSNSVTVINAATNIVLRHVAVGAGPWALAWNPTANKVYVADSADGRVSVIRTADPQVVAQVTVGAQPVAVAWASGVNMAYVACRGSDEVAILDGDSNARVKLLPVGDDPLALVWNRTSGKVYAANSNDGTVSVIGRE
jgi:YVTN family beta-propeller protein